MCDQGRQQRVLWSGQEAVLRMRSGGEGVSRRAAPPVTRCAPPCAMTTFEHPTFFFLSMEREQADEEEKEKLNEKEED